MDFLNQLKGYKTYFVAAAGALAALAAWSQGSIDTLNLVEALFAAAGAITLRHGVSTSASKVVDAIAAANSVQPNSTANDPNNLDG